MMLKRIVVALAALAAIGLTGGAAYPASGAHCTVTAGTPHIEYVLDDGSPVIQGVAGLSSCTKGNPAIKYTLTASMGDQSGTVTKACSSVTRFACGTSLIFEQTLVCEDSDDPSTLTLAVTATDGTVTKTSQAVTFTCQFGLGGGE